MSTFCPRTYSYEQNDDDIHYRKDTEIGTVTGRVAGGFELTHTIVVSA
jgi:hypothetical protein